MTKTAARDKVQRWRAKNIAAGLCACGKAREQLRYKSCDGCRGYAATRRKRLGTAGGCFCGRPSLPGRKQCLKCTAATWAATYAKRLSAWTSEQLVEVYLSGRPCAYCSVPTDPTAPGRRNPNIPSLDHVVPRNRGGQDVCENVVIACGGCNFAKSETPLPTWLDWCYARFREPPHSGARPEIRQALRKHHPEVDVAARWPRWTFLIGEA